MSILKSPPITVVISDFDPSDAELFERFRTDAFSFGRVNGAIRFERVHAKLDLAEWHDTKVPKCYRARVGEIALVTFERFRNRIYSDELRHAFVCGLRRDVYRHLEPIAPPFGGSHDQ